jgi:superfamily II DNA helicase RecQ
METDQNEINFNTILESKFHHQGFKSDWQEEAVKKIYEGNKNVIVSLPTHGGKSLCYEMQSE